MAKKLTKDQLSMLRDINASPNGRLPMWVFSHFKKTAKNIVDRLFDAGMLGYVGRHNDIVITDAGRRALESEHRNG